MNPGIHSFRSPLPRIRVRVMAHPCEGHVKLHKRNLYAGKRLPNLTIFTVIFQHIQHACNTTSKTHTQHHHSRTANPHTHTPTHPHTHTPTHPHTHTAAKTHIPCLTNNMRLSCAAHCAASLDMLAGTAAEPPRKEERQAGAIRPLQRQGTTEKPQTKDEERHTSPANLRIGLGSLDEIL